MYMYMYTKMLLFSEQAEEYLQPLKELEDSRQRRIHTAGQVTSGTVQCVKTVHEHTVSKIYVYTCIIY